MTILENKIKEISDIIKSQEDCVEYIEEILNIASSNYLEDDLERLIDKYEIRDYLIENRINRINKKIILPVRRNLMRNKKFDYKVFMILRLLADNQKNNIVTKFMLIYNKDKILREYRISESDFVKGFNSLISIGMLKDEGDYYSIDFNKNKGYYLSLDRNTCKELVKESSRTIKTYIFMRDFLKYENDLSENSKGIISYGTINSGTGYKDKKGLKEIIDKLVDLGLIERVMIRTIDRIHYEYEIIDGTLLDYLPV